MRWGAAQNLNFNLLLEELRNLLTLMKNFLIKSRFLLSIPCLGLISFLLSDSLHESLYFHVELIPHGEYWRFVSGHLIYVSLWHWSLNTAGIILLIILFGKSPVIYNWISACLFILCIVGLGLLVLSKELIWYVGFSGVLGGLYIYAAIHSYQHSRLLSIAVIVLFSSLSGWQLLQGELVQGSLDIASSSYAHALGIAGGAIFAFSMKALKSPAKDIIE